MLDDIATYFLNRDYQRITVLRQRQTRPRDTTTDPKPDKPCDVPLNKTKIANAHQAVIWP